MKTKDGKNVNVGIKWKRYVAKRMVRKRASTKRERKEEKLESFHLGKSKFVLEKLKAKAAQEMEKQVNAQRQMKERDREYRNTLEKCEKS